MARVNQSRQGEVVFSGWRAGLAIAVTLALSIALIFQVINYVRPRLAERYTSRGADELAMLQYKAAQTSFEQALRLDPNDTDARNLLALTKTAPTDPLSAQSFWHDRNVTAILTPLAKATAQYATPKEALKAGVELYNVAQPEFAQYALQTAVKLDPNYPEAWHYLFLTYTELAKTSAAYTDKANDARTHRDSLTSLYLNP